VRVVLTQLRPQNSPIAWGQSIVYSNGKTFPAQRPPSAVGKLAGWALGKVIGKSSSSNEEETLQMCWAVSQEVAHRAGLWPRDHDSSCQRQALLKLLGPTPAGFENVSHHAFIGSPHFLEMADSGRRGVRTEGEGAGGEAGSSRLDDFDPDERGEAGCVPLLRGDFYRLVNVAVYENASLPKGCTTSGFSTAWTSSFHQSWSRLVAKAKEQEGRRGGEQGPGGEQATSVVDFEWRRAKSPAGLDKPHAVAAASSSSSSSSLLSELARALPAHPALQPSADDAALSSASPSHKSLDGRAGWGVTPAASASPSTAAPYTFGNGQAWETDKIGVVVCRAIPIDFEQTRVEGPRSMEGTQSQKSGSLVALYSQIY